LVPASEEGSVRRFKRAVMATVAAGLVLLALPPSVAAADGRERPAPGSVGVGDPVFPAYGNGGFQVQHYDIDVTYRPGDGLLMGGWTTRRWREPVPIATYQVFAALATTGSPTAAALPASR
jgi:hypothetical protein